MKHFLKEHMESIFVNTLKIWGCTWLSFLVWIIPLYIMRSYEIAAVIKYLITGIGGALFIMLFLFLFAMKQGQKSEFRRVGKKELLVISAVPSLIWMIVSCLLAGNCEITMGCLSTLVAALSGLQPLDFSVFTPFPIAFIFALFYTLSSYGGYLLGKHSSK